MKDSATNLLVYNHILDIATREFRNLTGLTEDQRLHKNLFKAFNRKIRNKFDTLVKIEKKKNISHQQVEDFRALDRKKTRLSRVSKRKITKSSTNGSLYV